MSRLRMQRALLAALVLVLAGLPTAGVSAVPKLSATPTAGLSPSGPTQVAVQGSGYDTSKGIYVAYCVLPPAGQPPTPCGGGADTSGDSGGSAWISDNPPRYGEGLAQPYGPGGSFSVTITVTPTIGDVDCTRTACAVVTRNDHTRTSDRSQDVFIPVSFADPSAADPDPTRAPSFAPTEPSPTAEPSAEPAPPPNPDPAASEPASQAGWVVLAVTLLLVAAGAPTAWRRRQAGANP